jgi:hypothetical protein
MRHLLALLAVLFASLSAQAQLVAVHFKDMKTANRFKDNLVVFQGEFVVVGEPLTNLTYDPDRGLSWDRNQSVELIVGDPGDPLKVPYEVESDGKRKITGKKARLGFAPSDIDHFSMYMREGSLPGMAADYQARRGLIEVEREARDKFAKGSPEYMAAHQRMVTQLERLQNWLETGLYPGAAEKVGKELAKERKVVAAEAAAARLDKARASVKDSPLHPDLSTLAKEISGGSDKFKSQESLHAKIIYREGIDDLRVKELLLLAEDIVNGFRVEFIDPYVDASYVDGIPEHTFIEWFFNYDDIPKAEKYMSGWYRMSWAPEHKEESLKMAGGGTRRAFAPEYIYHWRAGDDADLEGMVAHNLGHVLANLHYDKKRLDMNQDWLEEGVALYTSLEWLGRNSVNCKAFEEPGKYAKKLKQVEGEKTAQMGQRDWYNAMALEAGAAIDRLVLKPLFEMGDGDLAKSWSFFDWLAKKGGKEGQLFLRSCCEHSHDKPTFINKWRVTSEDIYGVKGADVFNVIDKRWKEFASGGQDKTGDTRKR